MALKLPRCDRRELYRYRQFYLTYPQIVESVPPQLLNSIAGLESPYAVRSLANIVESSTPQLTLSGRRLIDQLSFTHFAELIEIDDPLKRCFYEIECTRDNWSVRELKRQIGTLYYERSGLSKNKRKLAELVRKGDRRAEAPLQQQNLLISTASLSIFCRSGRDPVTEVV